MACNAIKARNRPSVKSEQGKWGTERNTANS